MPQSFFDCLKYVQNTLFVHFLFQVVLLSEIDYMSEQYPYVPQTNLWVCECGFTQIHDPGTDSIRAKGCSKCGSMMKLWMGVPIGRAMNRTEDADAT